MKVNGLQIGFTDEGRGLPLLFVHGFPLSREAWQKKGEDLRTSYRIIAPEESEKLAAAIPGAQLCLIPHAGHLVACEAPEAFNQAIRKWLASSLGQRLFPAAAARVRATASSASAKTQTIEQNHDGHPKSIS